MSPRLPLLFVLSFVAAAVTAATPPAKPRFAPDDPNRKLTSVLRQTLERLDEMARTRAVPSARIARQFENPLVRVSPEGEFQVYLKVTDTGAATRAELAQRGARIVRVADDLSLVEAWVLPDRIRDVAAHPAVVSVRPVGRPVTWAGSVMTEGDAILGADQVRALGFDGTGVKVGVISDDVDQMSTAQATGDLPANVTVLQRTPANGDEGTAMLEIVHDLAPGAQLYYYSGWNSSLDMRNGILALADAGCKVIVDDIGYYDQPYFEDGFLAQAADEVAQRGVVFCSAAGNEAKEHYEYPFTPANGTSDLHAWDGIADSTLRLDIPPQTTLVVRMQWDSPFGAAADDYDLYLCDDANLTQLLAKSENEQSGTQDPVEELIYDNTSILFSKTTYLAVDRYAGSARWLELFIQNAEWQEWYAAPGSVFGHPAARGAIAVGAINAGDQAHDDIADYSSQGPSRIRHPYSEDRLKPDLCGIDGVSVTGAGGFSTPFFGTSAAAPHVAAVAALLRQAHPNWSPADVRQALVSTAFDLGQAGPDYVYGAGRVRAREAAGVQFAGPTNVRGNITTTTWTKANSPYRVIALVRVLAGNTLTIEPGVDVLFDADAQFLVEGRLIAVGTETDSIRFMKGVASEWGGLRITGGDSCALHYLRISDGYADGSSEEGKGGGLYVSETDVGLAHVVISQNRASWSPEAGRGGGIWVNGVGRTLTMDYCTVIGNTAGGGGGGVYCIDASLAMYQCKVADNTVPAWYRISMAGGGIYYQGNGSLTLRSCVVVGNVAGGDYYSWSAGGGICVYTQNGTALVAQCTLVGNSAIDGNEVYLQGGVPLTIRNTIIWEPSGSNAIKGPGVFDVSYSDIGANWAGTGNFNADPMFLDPANDDYRLQWNSPCIDMGDPDSPRDPDGTVADMGAFYFDQSGLTEMLKLPNVEAYQRQTVVLPIRATLHDVRAVDLAFFLRSRLAVPDTPFVRSHAYQRQSNAQIEYSIRGDTVRVSLSGAQPISIADSTLVELAFVVPYNAPTDTVGQLVWLPYPYTNVQEKGVNVIHGALTVLPPPVLYGDVSDDGTITAFDASLILKYVVRILSEIDIRKADVTDNGDISSYDAALVLCRVLDPTYRFPVEGGRLPKPARSEPLQLRWVRDGGGWRLVASDVTALLAGQMTLELPPDTPVRVSGGQQIAYKQEGSTLRVAFVRLDSDEPVLFRLESDVPLHTPPHIGEAQFNEGQIAFTVQPPVEFALGQNVPNPFNPTTTIRFTTPPSGIVNVAIYDVNGRLVRTLVDGPVAAGYHEVVWDGRDAQGRVLASGVYIARLQAGNTRLVTRMVLAR